MVTSPLEPVYERTDSQEIRDVDGGVVPSDANKDNSDAKSQEANDPSRGLNGWEITLLWAGCLLAWYSFLQHIVLPMFMQENANARTLLFSQLSIRYYQYSEAAFFTAAVLNLIAFIFEETQEKRQLALLSFLIKGLSWHCDYMIVTGSAIITFDGYGALLLPSRYVQWSCTTPTMLFTLSKITDFTPKQTALTMFCDWVMIITGFIAAVLPPGLISCLFLFISYVTMLAVLYSLYCMIQSALAEANSHHSKMSLHFTLWSTFVIWNLFPVAWTVERIPSMAHLGEPLWLFSNFSAKVVFSSCILYNNFVTIQQRRLQAQIEQEHRDRIFMVADLKESLRHKDEFISVVGHELRTPLNAIIQLSSAMAGNLGKMGTWERHHSWLETITRSATHLLGIINDIITLRAARTGMHLKQELVHVDKVIDHVVRTLSPMAKRGVVLEKALASEKLPPIVADERRIIQLLSNLIGNALKFTDKGKVLIIVQADKGARHVIVKIQDTGCGIAPEELRHLLVPFKQANMTMSRKYGGTGLGLSIAQQLVDAHAGKLDLESVKDIGTLVVVKLPVLQPETRESLQKQFREDYTASGNSFTELMSPDVARAEGRRSAVFMSSMDDSMVDKRRQSLGDTSQFAVVEQYASWSAFNETEDPAGSVSAAASGVAGPPPMAVALVSSLFSTETSHQNLRNTGHFGSSHLKPAGATSAHVVPAGLAPGSYHSVRGGSVSGVAGKAAGGNVFSPSSYSVPGARDSNRGSLSDEEYSRTLESLELELDQRQRLMAWAQMQSDMKDRASSPSSNGAMDRPSGGHRPSTGQSAQQSHHGMGRPIPDYIRLPAEEGDEEEANREADAGEMDEENMYAGEIHKPPVFNDDYDGNEEYYAYDSRMSYEYRPSLDFGSGLSKIPQAAIPDALVGGTSPVSPGGRRSLSVKASLKSAIRRSIDAIALKSPKRSPMGSSTAGSDLGLMGSLSLGSPAIASTSNSFNGRPPGPEVRQDAK